jgi:hypothetical protein
MSLILTTCDTFAELELILINLDRIYQCNLLSLNCRGASPFFDISMSYSHDYSMRKSNSWNCSEKDPAKVQGVDSVQFTLFCRFWEEREKVSTDPDELLTHGFSKNDHIPGT